MKKLGSFLTSLLHRRRAAVIVSLLTFTAFTMLFLIKGGGVNASSLLSVASIDPLFPKASRSANKIAPEVLTDTLNERRASVVIFLTDQADVSSASRMKDQDARGWYV